MLLSQPAMIRLAFFTTFWYTIFHIFLVLFFFNTIISNQYAKGLDISETLLYVFNKIQEFNIVGFIVTFIIIVIIWNVWIYPIGEGSMVYALNSEDHKLTPAITKGLKKFFVMLKFEGLDWSFWFYTFITSVWRIWMMDILDNALITIIVIIRWLTVFWAMIFWPYAKYYILFENASVFDALRKSASLAFENLRTTIKALIFEKILWIRFIINAIIIVVVPLALVHLAVAFDVMDNQSVEIIIWVITGILILLAAYINGIFSLFFNNYWLKIFEEAKKNLE